MAVSSNDCSRPAETSSARLAEVSTAMTTQTMATATMPPIGTTRLSRALFQRDRLRSPAICDCAAGNTLPPFDYKNGAWTLGSKD